MTTTPISGSGFSASAWLNQIKGTAPAPSPVPTPTSTSPSSTPAPSDILGIPSNVLALLQGTGDAATTSNELSPLFNVSSSDPLAGVYNTQLYNSTTIQPIETAIAAANQQAAETTTQNNFVQDLINGLNAASNAYNQTLLAQSQSVLDTNKGLIA